MLTKSAMNGRHGAHQETVYTTSAAAAWLRAAPGMTPHGEHQELKGAAEGAARLSVAFCISSVLCSLTAWMRRRREERETREYTVVAGSPQASDDLAQDENLRAALPHTITSEPHSLCVATSSCASSFTLIFFPLMQVGRRGTRVP